MKWKTYRKYKPSGVEWLGYVPEHWSIKRLKYLTSINDETLAETTNPDLEIHYVDISSVDSTAGITRTEELLFDSAPSRARRIVRTGDTIVSTVRTYLRAIAPVVNPDPNLIVSTGFAVVRPRRMDHSYLAFALRSSFFIDKVVSMSVGVSYPAINASEIGLIEIPVPHLSEQKRIAAYLEQETCRIDKLILGKERLIALLQEKRTALISHAVTKGLDPNVKLKPSGVEWLGDVPEHWEEKRLKHILISKKGAIKTGPFGSQLLLSEMIEGEIKVYNQRNVLDNDFIGGENYISDEKFQELKEFQTHPGDFLVTTRGTIGSCAVLPEDAEKGILHPCLMRLQIDGSRISKSYLEILIQHSGVVLTQLQIKSNSTTIEVIYQDSLKNVILFIPPVPEQHAIASYLNQEVKKMDSLKSKIETAISKLKEYRTALISAAVTGKIDVREVA